MTTAAASPGRRLAFLVVATIVSYPLGLALGSSWLLPVLNAAPAYATMASRLRSGDRHGAVVAVLAWGATLAVCGTLAFALWPADPGETVVNGPRYRDEMFHWVRTGEGAEGSPGLFLLQHLLHVAAFVVLSLLTASAVSILMGAVLMNYMSFYVASLARAGAPIWAVVLLGWQPWALCRVAAFCVLGAVLAEPLMSRLVAYPYAGLGTARRLVVAAGAGLLADGLLKASLAPLWGRWLRVLLP